MELVGGRRKHVNIVLFHIDAHMADGLHGIRMKRDPASAADGADLLYGLNGADLVIGIHYRNQTGVVS